MQNKVFISYKNSVNGILTEDAAMAAELYAALSAAGIPTFYATETLLERGTDRFKEIIDKELDQCLIMIVVGTSLLNINSSWVKYEWDGFCLDILNEQKIGKVFTYLDGVNPHVLPRALRNAQSFDKSKTHVSVIVRFIKNALLDLGEGVRETEAEENNAQALLGADGICGTNDPIVQLRTNRNKYTPVIHHLANWLISLPHQWSTYDTGTTAQNANTCEGLLAMKCIGYDLEKKAIYRKVFERITGSVTERGLISKSLQTETVVCTSMLLLLAAMECAGNHNAKTEVFSRMAEHLWSQRNEDAGWGVYCERTEEQFCCTVNTCWALIALSQYPSVANTDAYKMLCRQMFELDSDGLFGFYIGGKPKLIATAMSLCLLHILAEPVRTEILENFKYQKAVDFVFDRFTRKGIQVEQEELYGIDKDGYGAKKVPWNHITCAAALTVLAQAYKAGVLSESRWEALLQHIDQLLQNDTVSPVGGKQFYVPDGIDSPRVGVFTFPTAYLIWGLQKVQNAIDYKLD